VSLVVLSRLDGDLRCRWPRSWVQVRRRRVRTQLQAATSSVDRPPPESPFILGVATGLVDPGLTAVGAVT